MRVKGYPSRSAYTRAAQRHRELKRALECLVRECASDAAVAETARLVEKVGSEWDAALVIFYRLEKPFRAIRNAEWDAETAARSCPVCFGRKNAACHAHAVTA